MTNGGPGRFGRGLRERDLGILTAAIIDLEDVDRIQRWRPSCGILHARRDRAERPGEASPGDMGALRQVGKEGQHRCVDG